MANRPKSGAPTYSARNVVLVFARVGVSLDVIARALVLKTSEVESICARALESGDLARMPPVASENKRDAMVTELVNLRQNLADARNELRDRESSETAIQQTFVGVARMTKTEAQVAASLVQHGRASKEQLFHELYSSRIDVDVPEPKIVDVMICKLRKKLGVHGIGILTVWGWGYALEPNDVAKLRALAEAAGDAVMAPSLAPELEDMHA